MPRNDYDDDDDDDLFKALQSVEPCGNCGAEGAKVPCMSGCGEVFYCSKECMMHHASNHRLRCRMLRGGFNDDSEEEDSSDEEYETDSDEDDEDDEEYDESSEEEEQSRRAAPKKGKKKGARRAARSGNVAVGGEGGVIMVDADVEKRIEEKIMRRLKQQEENRIAQAIDQRMREKAGWGGEDMMRFMMELRARFDMSSSQVMAQVRNRGSNSDMMGMLQNMMSGMPMPAESMNANPQAEEKEATTGAVAAAGSDDERARSGSKESAWNNACLEFAALRVVVWKHNFLPRMQCKQNPDNGIWNAIEEVDGDESFSHIAEGDALLSVNGRVIDEAIQTKEDLDDFMAGFASPLILKFEAADPNNGKVHDYTVTWSNGPLGVTLKDDATNQKVPIVNRLTKKPGSVAVKQNIAIGDILVAINNIDTIQLGCSLSMSILKKVQLPAKLRFRGVGGPPPGVSLDTEEAKLERMSVGSLATLVRPASYEVNWGEGPLGLTIIPGLQTHDLPVIKKVTGTGTSPGIEKAQIGDLLDTMNGKSTAGMPFDKVVAYLKSTPKPILLHFKVDTESTPGSRSLAAPSPSPSPSKTLSLHETRAASPRPRPSPSKPKPTTMPAPAASMPSPTPAPRTPSPPTSQSGDEYHIVWGDGQLGLTIDANKHTSGSYIKRIGDQGAAACLSADCVGDYLMYINERDVSKAPFSEIVKLLQNVPRPVTLRFRRKSRNEKQLAQSMIDASAYQNPHRMSDTPTRGRKPSAHEANGIYYYNVVWQANTPLGLSLRGADNGSEYPYITRVTGAGSAAHLPSTVINDCLISINGRSVHKRDKTFDEVMSMLKDVPKPITLKFQTRNDTQGSLAATSIPHQQKAPHQSQQQRQPLPQQPPQQQQPYYSSSAPSNGSMQSSAPPPAPAPAPSLQQSQGASWRQNRTGAASNGPSGNLAYQTSALPMPRNPLAASRQNSSGMSRSFVNPSDQAHGLSHGPVQDEKFSSIQAPFLAQSQISTTRRKKMLKGLKK